MVSQDVLTSCLCFPHWSGHTEDPQYWQTPNETPIVTNKSNKRLNLSISIWRRTLGNGLQILLGGEHPSFTHVMGQIVNLGLEYLTFGWFQLETMFAKSVKNYTHPFQVLLLCSGENHYVIQVDEAISEIQFTQTV